MSRPDHYYDPYDRLAPFYDWMAKTMLLPFGGEAAFRRRAIEALNVRAGMQVLDLGCGTGSMTRELLQLGAIVTAVDLSAPMLARAQRRAPGATYRHMDILELEPDGGYDRVVLSFVLHEMDRTTRRKALAIARESTTKDGEVGVLDFAAPPAAGLRWGLRTYLRLTEPATALELVDGGIESELEASGLVVERHVALAEGTAVVVIAQTC